MPYDENIEWWQRIILLFHPLVESLSCESYEHVPGFWPVRIDALAPFFNLALQAYHCLEKLEVDLTFFHIWKPDILRIDLIGSNKVEIGTECLRLLDIR